jgi:RNA polymerase sigma-70 factor (ECF subfamily)
MAAHDSAAQALGPPEEPGVHTSPAGAEVPPFEAIFQQYFAFVWSSTKRLGVSSAATDDVVQEIFMVIHAKLHTLRQPQSLRSWIYGIVRRTVSDHHRSQRTRTAAGAALAEEAEILRPASPTPEDLSGHNDQVKLLWSLLDTLDPVKREVFVLAELEEMTAPEIAEALDIPLNTAYSRLRAARQAFEESLSRRALREQGRS